jgi:hypothetical protein
MLPDPWFVLGWLALSGVALVVAALGMWLVPALVNVAVAFVRAWRRHAHWRREVARSADVAPAAGQTWWWLDDAGDVKRLTITEVYTLRNLDGEDVAMVRYTQEGASMRGDCVRLDRFEKVRRARGMACGVPPRLFRDPP